MPQTLNVWGFCRIWLYHINKRFKNSCVGITEAENYYLKKVDITIMEKQKSLRGAKNSLKTEMKIKSLFKGSNFASIIQMHIKGITDNQIAQFIQDKGLRFTISHTYGIFSFYLPNETTPLTGEQIYKL